MALFVNKCDFFWNVEKEADTLKIHLAAVFQMYLCMDPKASYTKYMQMFMHVQFVTNEK